MVSKQTVGERGLRRGVGMALILLVPGSGAAAGVASLAPQVSGPDSTVQPWRVFTYALPEESVIEPSGLLFLEDGRLMICTRRGDVWILDQPLSEDPSDHRLTRFTEGLQEPLGLLAHEGWIYTVQRGELSRMRDGNGDDLVDEIETVCDEWRVGGNYHEYNFGPRLDREGNFWITTNRAFGENPFGDRPWRGFALRISPDGEMIPTCSGLRSPAGLEISPWGDVFYTDNQGEWCGASKLSHLEAGDFHGHPWGLFSCHEAEWTYPYPGDPKSGIPMPEVQAGMPSFKLPAVWFPYDKMGQSPAGMAWDQTGGSFGPFEGQLFVSDQHHASVMRVDLEQVEGHWQGACFPFRDGLQCGVIRLLFAPDGSLLCGQTHRGWGSRGRRSEGLERLIWTGDVPFEILHMRAQPDGFALTFTAAIDPASVPEFQERAQLLSYTYLHQEEYGSPEIDTEQLEIESVHLLPDGRTLELWVDGLRAGYVHELHALGVRSSAGSELLHPEAYYTLIKLPVR